MRLFSLGLLALALTATASAQPDRPLVIDGDFGPATLVIEYQDGDDLFLRSTLSLSLNSGKPIPRGAIHQIAILSKGGQWITLDSFLSSGHTTGSNVLQTEARLPPPKTLSLILLKPRRGPWQGWKVERDDGYTETEWTYYDGAGNHVRSAPCEPRACFNDVVDAFNQAESTASSFQVEISGFSFGVE